VSGFLHSRAHLVGTVEPRGPGPTDRKGPPPVAAPCPGSCTTAPPATPARHVQDGLLPLKQTVRHLLGRRTTLIVLRLTARLGDGLAAPPIIRGTGPDTDLTDSNAAPTIDAVGRQLHERAGVDRSGIPSPAGWTPPSG
jgi:hypothetical protein